MHSLCLVIKKMSSSKLVRNAEVTNGSSRGGKVGQVRRRRRLHASRPYQERLLNMAEARREIVTALKFHRASMKQHQKQQQDPLDLVNPPPLPTLSPPQLEMNPADNPIKIQPSHTDPSAFSFSLPSQTLGLNLNIQNFSNLSTSLFTSPSSSYSSPSTTTDEFHSGAEDAHNRSFIVSQTESMGAYPAMDCEVIKQIKSMGDFYDMVWSDTMNSLTSVWWLKFSNTAEASTEDSEQADDLPSWLNNTFACPSLPWMDIGEIEEIDGDWFA